MKRFLLTLSMSTLFVFGACGSTTSPTAPDPISPVQVKSIASILCNNQSAACSTQFDTTVTISWTCTNSTSGSVTATLWTGTSGSQTTEKLKETRDYELKCVGNNSEIVTATVKVSVASLPVPGVFFLSGSCTAVDSRTQRVSLLWTESLNTDNYRLERRIRSTGTWSPVTTSTPRTHTEVVQNDIDNFWRVYSVNSSGERLSAPAELLVCANAIPGGSGTPKIELSFVPPIGSFLNLRGLVQHVYPPDYRVVCYILVRGVWWPKPSYTDLTSINSDGTWVCDITTGGVDEEATEVRAYLVTSNFVHGELPVVNGRNVIAIATAKR